jgi:hypothetical protein
MFGITSIEHGIATLAHDIVKGAHAVDTFLEKAAVLGVKEAPLIENLTAMVDPAAVPFERAAFAALGVVAKAAGEADAAAAAKGISITLDQQAWAEFKAVYDELSSKAKFLASGSVPVTTPAGA